MRKGISLFYEVLYWSNNQPVVLDDQIDENLNKTNKFRREIEVYFISNE